MQYFILGLLALVIALYAVQRFSRANTTAMARQIKFVAGVLTLVVALAFFLRGAVNQAIALAVIGAWLLGWSRGIGSFGGGATKSSGQTSRITTDFLDIELDHDTGEISGQVLNGIFEGRAIESLKPVEIALLWQDCQFVDPQSAQVLEVYLDRMHPAWREDMARGEHEMRGGADGRMSAAEAFEILGVQPGCSDDEIRRAHRELMLKLHPDRGGSTYLASKINEAKEVLLGE